MVWHPHSHTHNTHTHKHTLGHVRCIWGAPWCSALPRPSPHHGGSRGIISESRSQGCALAPSPYPGQGLSRVVFRQPFPPAPYTPPGQTPSCLSPTSHLVQAGAPAQGQHAVPSPPPPPKSPSFFLLQPVSPSCQRTSLATHPAGWSSALPTCPAPRTLSSSWYSGGALV